MALEIEWEMLGQSIPVLLVFLFLVVFVRGRRPRNYPPGLPNLPFVGSLFHMRGMTIRKLFWALKEKYGNMASFDIFGTRFVLVNEVSLIRRILSQPEFAAKPEMIITATKSYLISEGRETNLGVIGGNGPSWQKQRRFLMRYVHDLGFGKTKCEPMVMAEVKDLIDYIQQQNGEPIYIKRLFTHSVVNLLWGIVAGMRYSYDDDRLIRLTDGFLIPANTNLLSPIFYIPGINKTINYIPVLRNNLKPLKTVISFVKGKITDFTTNFDLNSNPSMMSSYMEEIKKQDSEQQYFNINQMTALVAETFGGGIENITNNLTMVIYQVASHPSVQLRLQQELDEVVGRDRLPSISDIKNLPYTMATIHEVQRTFVSVAIILHSAMEDCTFDGYNIPKGTVIVANLEAVLLDPKLWKNSQMFDPENFLDENGQYVKNIAFLPFGIGKRVCPGENIAESMLFLVVSSLLQRFFFTIVEADPPPVNKFTFSQCIKYTTVARLR